MTNPTPRITSDLSERLPTWCPFLLENVRAEPDAPIADVDTGPSDQLLDPADPMAAAPATERAPQRAVHPLGPPTTVKHATSLRQSGSGRHAPDGRNRVPTAWRTGRGTIAPEVLYRGALRPGRTPSPHPFGLERALTGRPREGFGAALGSSASTSAEAANAERPPEPLIDVGRMLVAPSVVPYLPGSRVPLVCSRIGSGAAAA
jgi:hypothetical protein